MHETPSSFSHLESPAPGAVLPAGRHMLRGWVWPKPGGLFADVRARVGARAFAAVHGRPRADLAAHFRTGRPQALAGFEVVVELAPGPAAVALEALGLDGRWTEFQTVSFTVEPAHPPVEVAQPAGELRWHEFGRALAALLREQRRQTGRPVRELAAELAAGLPHPRYLLQPAPPFHGHLDEPATLSRSIFGRVPLFGYLFHETQPIRRVLATFDLQAWQAVEHTRPSPQAGAFFPAFATAAQCGLHGYVDVPAQLVRPAVLRLYGELDDGSLQLCSVVRTRLADDEAEKRPYAAQSEADFDDTVAALRDALAARPAVVVEDDELRREIARLGEDFRRRAPRARPPAPPLPPAPATRSHPLPTRALLVSHNFNLEGAPLFLLDLGRHLASLGIRLTVASPADGPLRARFAEYAYTVVADAGAVFAARSREAALAAIDNAGRALEADRFDLVVANTFTTFWAVHAARRCGRRVLLYVHESTTPASFYADRADPAVIALAEEAFGAADAVSFTTASTRGYHLDYGRPQNHRLASGWIDVARLDAWRAAHPRTELRARLGLRPDELLVSNIGTVCDRKGQHTFARAVDLLWRRHPALAARARFVLLGGRRSLFDEQLQGLLAELARPNLVVEPETPDYLPYFCAADLFVCSSYEESSPRVVLEAMACGAPILSSGVHGVPELVRPDREAVLVPPGDTHAWCEALARLLHAPATGVQLAARARERVTAEFDAAVVLPRHAALAAAVAAGALER